MSSQQQTPNSPIAPTGCELAGVTGYAVGAVVEAVNAILKPADDYSPTYYLCNKGDVLIIRELGKYGWDYYVSHSEITNNSFGVKANEIKPHNDQADR